MQREPCLADRTDTSAHGQAEALRYLPNFTIFRNSANFFANPIQ
jgi:hypothetical protein